MKVKDLIYNCCELEKVILVVKGMSCNRTTYTDLFEIPTELLYAEVYEFSATRKNTLEISFIRQ